MSAGTQSTLPEFKGDRKIDCPNGCGARIYPNQRPNHYMLDCTEVNL